MTDPNAAAKDESAAQTAAALASLYAAFRIKAQLQDTLEQVRGLVPDWVLQRRELLVGRSLRLARKVARDVPGEVMEPYLETVFGNRSQAWGESFEAALARVDPDEMLASIADEFQARLNKARAEAEDMADFTGNFASLEQAEAEGKRTKTWRVQGRNHRATHAALDGSTIGLDERFANGLRFPKSPGPPQETVNCDCYLTYGG